MIAFWVGLAAAMKLSLVISKYLSAYDALNGKWLPFLSFILVFLLFVYFVNFFGKMIQKGTEIIIPKFLNSIAGAVLYIFIYTMIFGVLLFYFTKLNVVSRETLNSSKTYRYICPVTPAIIDLMGTIIPIFKDIFAQLEEFFANLSGKMS
jgi:membrane protein required for colicin V production